MKNRKGQLNALAPAVLALVFAAIVLVFGLIITQSLVNTQDGKVTGSKTNESVTPVDAGILSIGVSSVCGFSSWNASAVYNVTLSAESAGAGTNETLSEGTHYKIFSGNGSILNLTTTYNDSTADYTYTWGGVACESGNKTVVGLGTFADFWEIIVLAVIIGIVIGLLLVIFGGTARRR